MHPSGEMLLPDRFVDSVADSEVIIDDVGTGWSSLERSATFPVFGFEIDRSITALRRR